MQRALGMIVLAGALLLAPLPARGEDAPAAVSTKRHADPTNKHSVQLPATWSVSTPSGKFNEGSVIHLDVAVPGLEGTFLLELYHLPGLCASLPQAYWEKPVLWKRENADDATVLREPLPHLKLDLHRGEEEIIRVHTYWLVEGRGFTLVVEGPAALWPRIKDAYFRAVPTIETRLGPWPAKPRGYDRSVKDGFVYYVHPQTKKADVKSYQAYFRKMEREFRKRHGKFAKDVPHEYAIVFHPSRAMAEAFLKDSGGRSGHVSHVVERRIFAVPIKRDDTTVAADLRLSIWGLFLVRRYGGPYPPWMYDGETLLQYVEGGEGAALPAATDWLLEQPDTLEAPFTIDEGKPTGDAEIARKRQALYMALFQTGPARYRKAYKRYLKAIGDGQDWTVAATENLLSLDLEKMQSDAAALLTKMRKASGK